MPCTGYALGLTMPSRVGVAARFPRPAVLTTFDGDRGAMIGCITGEGSMAPPWKEGDTSGAHGHTIQGLPSHVSAEKRINLHGASLPVNVQVFLKPTAA